MSSDKRYVLRAVPPGPGRVLDLGGGAGELRPALIRRGYRYANIDLRPGGAGAIVADAEGLPFRSRSFDLVVSSDTLEHFARPGRVLDETRRVLRESGLLVIWVPFLHPFHGDDLYRYTPEGLKFVLTESGFEVMSIDAPLWVFSVFAQAANELLRRAGVPGLGLLVVRGAAWLDERIQPLRGDGQAFAAAYLVTARPIARSSAA